MQTAKLKGIIYIWIGTDKGLNRFDGQNIVTYEKDKGGQYTILNNRVRDIVVGVNGQLWVAVAGGLLRYDDGNDSFVSYTKDETSSTSLLNNNLNVLHIDSQDRLWIGSAGGLSLYQSETDDFIHYTADSRTKGQSLPHGSVISIIDDDNGFIWVGTLRNSSESSNSLSKIELESGSVETFIHDPSSTNSIQAGAIIDMAKTDSGELWVASSRGGISKFKPITQEFLGLNKLNSIQDIPLNFQSLRVYDIIEDGENIWLSTIGDGLLRINPQLNTYNQYFSDISDPQSLSANQLSDLHQDNQGNLWVGTLNRGVNFYSARSSLFNSVTRALPQDYIWSEIQSISELEPSKHIIKSFDDFFFEIHTDTNQIIESNTQIEQGNELTQANEFIRLDDETYLQLTNEGQLFYSSTGSNKQLCVLRENDRCANIAVKHVYVANNDDIWLSTFTSGLMRLDSERNVVQRYAFSDNRVPTEKPFLSGLQINDIAEDHAGNIWVATNTGLNKVYPKLDRIDYYLNDLDDDLSLPARNVSQIYIASENSVWLATEKGLVHVTPSTEQFTLFDTEDGLATNDIRCMLADGDYLWFSTDVGITQWHLKEHYADNYYQQDGLQTRPYSQNACHKGASGSLYFLSGSGYTFFDANNFIDIPITTTPVITDVLVADNSIPFDSKTMLDVSYQYDVIQFEYGSINYSQPAADQYQIMLENFDTNWREMGTTKAVFYSNLDVGLYDFKVRSIDRFGNVSQPVSVRINKLEHPLRSDLMIMVYLLTAVLLVVFFVRKNELKVQEQMLIADRERKVASQLRELSLHLENAREEERKYVARELHDELAQTLVVLRLDLRWIENALEQGQSSHVVERMPDINEVLDRGVRTVNKIAKGLRPSALDQIGINSAIEAKLNEIAKRSDITSHFETNCRGLELNDSLTSALYRIFQECITNILKHAQAKNVWVTLNLNGEELVLTVKDDGIGITKFDLEKSGSFGVIGMRERVNSRGGKMAIQSNNDQGTQIEIKFNIESTS